jgi:hypothetical protein
VRQKGSRWMLEDELVSESSERLLGVADVQ